MSFNNIKEYHGKGHFLLLEFQKGDYAVSWKLEIKLLE